jgi:T-complex protein 1 subunit theta
VDCIVTGGQIDDMALHFIEKYKMMIIRITSKFELRRLCRAVKARPLVVSVTSTVTITC